MASWMNGWIVGGQRDGSQYVGYVTSVHMCVSFLKSKSHTGLFTLCCRTILSVVHISPL
jgi:hypothetical protein